jgi:hypothetical protein
MQSNLINLCKIFHLRYQHNTRRCQYVQIDLALDQLCQRISFVARRCVAETAKGVFYLKAEGIFLQENKTNNIMFVFNLNHTHSQHTELFVTS